MNDPANPQEPGSPSSGDAVSAGEPRQSPAAASAAQFACSAMTPAALLAAARRHVAQADFAAAELALLAMIHQVHRSGGDARATWADLGVVRYALDHKDEALLALLRAIGLGVVDLATVTAAMMIALELGRGDAVRAAIGLRVPDRLLVAAETAAQAGVRRGGGGRCSGARPMWRRLLAIAGRSDCAP